MTITSDLSFANALLADFKAGIATPESIATQYPNAPFTPPQNTEHLVYDLVMGDEEQLECGSPGQDTFQKVGHLAVRIYVPAETGAARALELSDLIKDRYRQVTRAGAEFRTPYTLPAFRQDEWWVTPVICPFQADRFA